MSHSGSFLEVSYQKGFKSFIINCMSFRPTAFTPATRVRIPLGTPIYRTCYARFFRYLEQFTRPVLLLRMGLLRAGKVLEAIFQIHLYYIYSFSRGRMFSLIRELSRFSFSKENLIGSLLQKRRFNLIFS